MRGCLSRDLFRVPGGHAGHMTHATVTIQITSEPSPSTPSWFGEVVLIVEYLRKHGVLTRISEEVRFARRRFGHYEIIDFLAVQIALRH